MNIQKVLIETIKMKEIIIIVTKKMMQIVIEKNQILTVTKKRHVKDLKEVINKKIL